MSGGNKKIRKSKLAGRLKRKLRIRGRVHGSLERPRLTIYRSNRALYAQMIDDTKGVTLVAATSAEEQFKGKSRKNLEAAQYVGETVAKRAIEKGFKQCTFDRNGFLYHGRVKALADKAREAGLKF